jgi:hypothetical protein
MNRSKWFTLIGTGITGAYFGYTFITKARGNLHLESELEDRRRHALWKPSPRSEMLKRLQSSKRSGATEYDLLVIGGGATGTGVALDAASRGLKVALVERDDFASGIDFEPLNTNILYTFHPATNIGRNKFKIHKISSRRCSVLGEGILES